MGWGYLWEEWGWTLREKLASIREAYWRSARVRAVADALVLLACIVGVDWLLGCPTSLRLAYVAPVVHATQRDGKRAGSMMVAATLIAMIAIGYHVGLIKPGELGLEIAEERPC
jgi:hypothetical protein